MGRGHRQQVTQFAAVQGLLDPPVGRLTPPVVTDLEHHPGMIGRVDSTVGFGQGQVIGLSTNTCFPARAAATTRSAWVVWGVATKTPSMSDPRRSSSERRAGSRALRRRLSLAWLLRAKQPTISISPVACAARQNAAPPSQPNHAQPDRVARTWHPIILSFRLRAPPSGECRRAPLCSGEHLIGAEMPIATPHTYRAMLDAARDGQYALPAINVTSSETINAALRGFAEAESDGIIQISTGGGEFLSGQGVKDMAVGAAAGAAFAEAVADRYPVNVALHTDHCQPDKVDSLIRPLLAISRERQTEGRPPIFQSHMLDASAPPPGREPGIGLEAARRDGPARCRPGVGDRHRGRRRGHTGPRGDKPREAVHHPGGHGGRGGDARDR